MRHPQAPLPLSCLRVAGLAALLFSTGGCYHFAPREPGTPPPAAGQPVRVHLSEPSSFDVSGFTAHQIQRLDGSLLERRDDAWVIGTQRMHAVGGDRFEAGSWALTVPDSRVAEVDVQRFSWTRSVVAGGIGLAVIAVAIQAIQDADNMEGGEPPENGSGGGRSVIPVGLRIPFP